VCALFYASTTLIDSTSSSAKHIVSPPAVLISYPCQVLRMSSFDWTWYRVFRRSVVVTSATSIELGIFSWNRRDHDSPWTGLLLGRFAEVF
jgi:hypothetical protein